MWDNVSSLKVIFNLKKYDIFRNISVNFEDIVPLLVTCAGKCNNTMWYKESRNIFVWKECDESPSGVRQKFC